MVFANLLSNARLKGEAHMFLFVLRRSAWFLTLAIVTLGIRPLMAEGNPHRVKHIIIVMQENRSFDNYFGALAYAPGSPYHSPHRDGDHDGDDRGGCRADDHRCVDGLTCKVDAAGNFTCLNSNLDDDGSTVFAFHDSRRCVGPDLDHGWLSTHQEANFLNPNNTLAQTLSDGFVRVNDITEQHDNGVETPTDDQTMAFYNQNELPFYYDLAQKFALNDRYFSPVLGPTFPNRAFFMAATSFGHLTTSETFPPPGGYKPITGTIFDLMDAQGVSWSDFFQDAPQGGSFRPFSFTPGGSDPHFLPLSVFFAQVAGTVGTGTLPQVTFIDPNFGIFGTKLENDEHPPTDIQRGQAMVSKIINAVRNGPFWKDTIIFVTYDEHGGFYDHVTPPRANQGHALNPDGIDPGQCADLSNSPASLQPGGGAECKISRADSIALCPALAANPTGPFPPECANFDQVGFRLPFMAISPFSKPHYVSHTQGDHTSMLALIEKIFMSSESDDRDRDRDDDEREGGRPHLTKRDQHANTLEDMFDFDRSPSFHTQIGTAAPPTEDCTPK
jgi:phospholipase C